MTQATLPAQRPAQADHQHPRAMPNSVGSDALQADSVTSAAIAPDAVGSSEIAVNAVGSSELADNAVDILAIVAAARDLLMPPGAIVAYGDDTPAPTGWLLCDGAAVSRTTFATLFGVIGTNYGTGDGSTTFNVPDLRQRFPLGKAAAGTGATMGATGGTIDHVHALDTASSHALISAAAGSVDNWHMDRKTVSSWTNNQEGDMANFGGVAGAARTTGTRLGGDTDSDNPPFQVVQFIIRTGNTS